VTAIVAGSSWGSVIGAGSPFGGQTVVGLIKCKPVRPACAGTKLGNLRQKLAHKAWPLSRIDGDDRGSVSRQSLEAR
jgi:hypothetical protein